MTEGGLEGAIATQPVESERPARVVEPVREDPLVAASVGAIGGPLGRWARAGVSWWTPLRIVIALAAVGYIVGFWLDMGCRNELWKTPERYEHLCYTDIAPLYSLRGFADNLIPYLQAGAGHQYLEYPVLTGVFMEIASLLTLAMNNLRGGVDKVTTFFDINVVMLFIPLAIAVAATALTVRRRPWDAAMVALAPTVILAATVNWDLLPLAFGGVALLLWSRQRPFAAGLLLGLAVAAKFYPVLFLAGFLLLTIRAGTWKAFVRLVAGTALAWLVVNVPVAIANYDGWVTFYRFSNTRGVDFGSIWFAWTELGFRGVSPELLNPVATGSFLALCAGIAWIVLSAPRRPRLAAVLFLVIAAFVLTNKVYSPQYSLWLVPLAVMARPRWRDFLIWQAGEVIYFAGIWWFLVGYGIEGTKGLTGQQYAAATFIHVAATVFFAVMVIRDIYRPDKDPIRSDGFADDEDDPGGGVFDRAPDRFTLDPVRRRTATSSAEPPQEASPPPPG